MFTLVVLIVTIVVCLSHVCFGHFKYLSAHNYKVRPRSHTLRLSAALPLASDQLTDSLFVSQIDTKETDVDAVENGRPARPSSSPTTKSQVSQSADALQTLDVNKLKSCSVID